MTGPAGLCAPGTIEYSSGTAARRPPPPKERRAPPPPSPFNPRTPQSTDTTRPMHPNYTGWGAAPCPHLLRVPVPAHDQRHSRQLHAPGRPLALIPVLRPAHFLALVRPRASWVVVHSAAVDHCLCVAGVEGQCEGRGDRCRCVAIRILIGFVRDAFDKRGCVTEEAKGQHAAGQVQKAAPASIQGVPGCRFARPQNAERAHAVNRVASGPRGRRDTSCHGSTRRACGGDGDGDIRRGGTGGVSRPVRSKDTGGLGVSVSLRVSFIFCFLFVLRLYIHARRPLANPPNIEPNPIALARSPHQTKQTSVPCLVCLARHHTTPHHTARPPRTQQSNPI